MSKPNRGHKPQNLKHIEPCAVEQSQPTTPVYDAFDGLDCQAGILESLLERLEEKVKPILHPIATGSGRDCEDPKPVVSPIVGCIQACSARLGAMGERLENLLSRIEC